jgi:hypothetical protein
MMEPRTELVLGILLGALVLFFALKTGGIGGAGAGASRDKNPILFWMGVSISVFAEAIAVIILISTLV